MSFLSLPVAPGQKKERQEEKEEEGQLTFYIDWKLQVFFGQR